jgi:hypothetical protein
LGRWGIGILLALIPMMAAFPTTRVAAAGQTFSVTTTVDNLSDTTCPSICSLRGAIHASNATAPGAGDHNTITFSIPTTDPGYTAGVFTMKPGADFDGVTVPTLIDGYSQTGARANSLAVGTDAILNIVIDGSSMPDLGGIGAGIRVADAGSGSTIRGLVINHIPGIGVDVRRATNVTIAGNYVGTDATGLTRAVNAGISISLADGVTNSTIGGATPADRNVVSSSSCGMSIRGSGSTGNVVQGNYSGLKATGAAPFDVIAGDPVGKSLQIVEGATGNTIGGLTAGARNVFAGDTFGVVMDGAGTSSNVVEGNYFGIKADGTASIDPPTYVSAADIKGVQIQGGATNNTVGGTVAGARNVVSGLNKGIVIIGTGTSGNIVQGNYIGTDATGTTAVGNVNVGVLVSEEATNNTIGGTDSAAGNLIARNTGIGVGVGVDGNDTATTGNRIVGNRIFANAEPGIDLGQDGITANASGTRNGPNNLQNYPVLTAASGTGVSGTLSSTASATFRIEVFANPTAVRQGQTFLGCVTTSTNGSGAASFAATVPALTAGQFVTTTATNTATGDTSEFSVPLTVTASGPPPTITSVSPPSGDIRGGASVTITGTGFVAGQTTVQFGGADATVQSVTATTIRVLTPARAAGAVTVSVTASGQNTTMPNGYSYGVVNTLPAPPPPGGAGGGSSPPLPGSRPAGVTSGNPNPVPAPRP